MAIKNLIEEYPFEGVVYKMYIDDNKPLDEQVEEKEIICRTKCDIQAASAYNRGHFVNATYNIYMPLASGEKIKFKRGDLFESEAYGIVVNGEIIGIYPSQLGGVSIYIKDIDV